MSSSSLVEGWSVASDEEEARGEREPIRFCTCGGCDDESEAAFFRLEDADVAAGDEPVDSRRVDPDLREVLISILVGSRFIEVVSEIHRNLSLRVKYRVCSGHGPDRSCGFIIVTSSKILTMVITG